jgi:glucose/arabinose dehydrogenase
VRERVRGTPRRAEQRDERTFVECAADFVGADAARLGVGDAAQRRMDEAARMRREAYAQFCTERVPAARPRWRARGGAGATRLASWLEESIPPMPPNSLRPLLAATGVALTAAAQTPLRLEPFVTGLVRPVLVTAPRGDLDRVFVVEQPGRVRLVRDGTLQPSPFLDLAALNLVAFGGEAGLLGLAFHPQYAVNGWLFVCHNAPPSSELRVTRFTRSAANPDAADPTSAVTILSTPIVYGNHNGGMVAFGPDGMLWWSTGDGGSTPPLWPSDPFNHAQRGDSLLGKVLRIDVDHPQPPLQYGIPASNPFAGPGDPRDEIQALGLRNPWRFSFDRLSGDLWLADVGGFREEIDFAAAGAPGGANYGWSCTTGTWCAGTAACTCNGPALTPPLFDYGDPGPAHAVIGGYVYRGVAIPDLRGTYFFADHMRVEVWSLRRAGTGTGSGIAQLTNRTAELAPPPGNVLVGPTAFGEDGYGELYLCDLSGTVYRIAPAAPAQAGLVPYGAGTPGCNGAHALSSPHSPVVGNPGFTLRCSLAPPSSVGLVAFASDADVAGTVLPFGVVAHVQVTSALLLLEPMPSDGSGTGTFAFAIPPSPPLVGFTLHAQAIWAWSPAACTPSPWGWSSSSGLSFTLQP